MDKKTLLQFLLLKLSRNDAPFFSASRNSEYPRIFRVTGANQNARKLLSTDLVNTKCQHVKLACSLLKMSKLESLYICEAGTF